MKVTQEQKNLKRAATITAATAAAVTAGAMSTNVHADAVTNNNQPQAAQQTNNRAQKQAAVKDAQNVVNQDKQDQAKA